ncbi:hypothetical protein [Microbacterium aquimaris]|uniref:Integrase n=1 Tax=Microbacterium aquimaris TaxID=459816 RepID=A0ABU5N7T7_9MICO|nr:hypothetical protein [Microbacterium aquimaris]MDZ8162160.1 hypothetical protein [Microbacterium aquimaris]
MLLSDVRPADLEAYQAYLFTHVRSPWQRHVLRRTVAYFWRYRFVLGTRALRFDPRLLPYWDAEPYPGKRGENATARIPESVHGPLLVWAMRFVDDFSDDILRGTETWRERRDAVHRREPIAWGTAPDKIRRYLDGAKMTGRPLPGRGGDVNLAAIARAIGCQRTALLPFAQEIKALAESLGVSDYAALDIEITGLLDGAPWTEGFRLEPTEPDSISSMAQLLQTACYIVIAFLSGMRDAEIKHLQVGAAEAVLDSQGSVVRWRAHSLAFKGEASAEGVPAAWIVGEPAARAIGVLERLRGSSGSTTPWLFAPVRTGPGAGSGGRGGNEALTVSGTILSLNRFIPWVQRYCRERGREDAIPDYNGRVWRLSTRQFRRTLAWYIARRPGGSIAGAIAYRHHTIQMFEGYAGTSDSGFRAEVEAEQALARGEHLLAMIERNDHFQLGGPAANEAYVRLRDMGAEQTFAGTVQTDPRRFVRLLNARGPEVYPGRYVTCVFDHAKAQCHASANGPDLPSCQPLTCQNVALSQDNVDVWQTEVAQIDADLAHRPALPPLLVDRLEKRRAQIRRLFEGNQDVSTS